MVRIISLGMGCHQCKDGVLPWKMHTRRCQILTTAHLSLVFMMAMEVQDSEELRTSSWLEELDTSRVFFVLLVFRRMLYLAWISVLVNWCKVVSKFCAKYLHTQVLRNEACSAGDLGASVQKAFFRMDEMMRGQRGWRELSVLGDKINKFTGMIEGFIWSPKGSDSNDQHDDWAFEDGPHSDFSGPTSGSTACVAVIRNNQLIVANAGDSRCVIARKGQAYNLSRDHKPELEAEKERILKAGGFIHAGRVNGSLNLSRAIGDMEFKQNKFLPADKQIVTANPDINVVDLCDDDDFIVLACDGVWDCMSSQQLVDFINEHINVENRLSAVCERVLDRCLAPSTAGGEGCDNMTMILVQFKNPIQSNTPTTEQLTMTASEAEAE